MKRSSQIMPKKFFHGDYVIDDVTEWTQNFHLYSCFGEVGSANKLQGQYLVSKCKYIIVFLGYTCQKTISMNNTFRECRSKVNITGLLNDLGTLTATTQSEDYQDETRPEM